MPLEALLSYRITTDARRPSRLQRRQCAAVPISLHFVAMAFCRSTTVCCRYYGAMIVRLGPLTCAPCCRWQHPVLASPSIAQDLMVQNSPSEPTRYQAGVATARVAGPEPSSCPPQKHRVPIQVLCRWHRWQVPLSSSCSRPAAVWEGAAARRGQQRSCQGAYAASVFDLTQWKPTMQHGPTIRAGSRKREVVQGRLFLYQWPGFLSFGLRRLESRCRDGSPGKSIESRRGHFRPVVPSTVVW
jgi:hypothetical protein